MSKKAVTLTIAGRVQGVGYRYSAQRKRPCFQIPIENSARDVTSGVRGEIKGVILGHQAVPPATCSMETMGSMKAMTRK